VIFLYSKQIKFDYQVEFVFFKNENKFNWPDEAISFLGFAAWGGTGADGNNFWIYIFFYTLMAAYFVILRFFFLAAASISANIISSSSSSSETMNFLSYFFVFIFSSSIGSGFSY